MENSSSLRCHGKYGPRWNCFLLAIWFGLATGLMEVTLLAMKKFVFHHRIWVPMDFVWMIPFADVLVFVLVGAGLWIGGWFSPKVGQVRFVSWVYLFLLCLSARTISNQLHFYAWILFAAGFATQLSRIFSAYPKTVHTLIRRTIPAMVVTVIVLGIGVRGSAVGQEGRAYAAGVTTELKKKPNVVLIVMDTVRSKSLSVYGNARNTSPQLEVLAEDGVVFDRAYSTSPWTLPSHSTMFTGRYPHELSANWLTPLDDKHPTLAEVLADHGYQTAGFVANLSYATYETGLNRGFMHYEDYPVSWGTILHTSWLTRSMAGQAVKIIGWRPDFPYVLGEEITHRFFQWIDQSESRPFFVFINYMDAHYPYLPPYPFNKRFDSGKRRPDRGNDDGRSWAPEEHQIELDAYEGAIAYVDKEVGKLIQGLQARDLVKNTLIIITSDHGDQFGEYGLIDHANSLYSELLHIPLFMIFPEQLAAGVRVATPVSLRDLPATILDLIEFEGESPFPGTSLAPLTRTVVENSNFPSKVLAEVSKGINRPEWLPVSKGDMKAIVFEDFHYIMNGDGSEEIYSLQDNNATNFIDSPKGREAAHTLRNILMQSLGNQGK